MIGPRRQLYFACAWLWLVAANGDAQAQRSPEGIGGRPWVQPVQRSTPARPAPVEAPIEAQEVFAEPRTGPDDDGPVDEDAPSRPAIGRQLIVDGHPSWPSDLAQPVDGVVTQADADGIEPEPALDRRQERQFRRDPFDPIGIRMGSFMIFPEAELAAAAYSNVFRGSADPLRDAALEIRPSVRAVSMWSVHALELRAEGTTSLHQRYASEDDRAALLEARGRIDLTRRTNIEALAAWELAQEMRGSIDVPIAASERGDV